MLLLVVILGRPIVLIDDAACQATTNQKATAVDPLDATPCHGSDRLQEVNTGSGAHSCACPAILPSADGLTAVAFLVHGWHFWVHAPETAVAAPPIPPPRSF